MLNFKGCIAMNRHQFKEIRVMTLRSNQTDLARALGVSSNTVSRFELGTMRICNRTKYAMLYLAQLGSLPRIEPPKPPSRANQKSSKSSKRKKRR